MQNHEPRGGSATTAVGVIGVGRIGTPLVARLVAAGHEVVATDVRPEREEPVEQAGGRWAPDVPAVADAADVVVTVLPGSPELRELVLGDGRLPALLGGKLWIDLTSASYQLGRACARAAAEYGVPCLGAPLGGGVEAMRSGAVTLYAGGEAEVLATAQPLLRSFATTVHHVGGAGAGYLVKLLVNLLWFGQAALTTEAMLLAQRNDITPDTFSAVLRGSAGDSAFATQHLPRLLAGDYLRDFGLDRCVEELQAVEEAAEESGAPHAITSAVAGLHRAALAHFGPVDGELLASALLEHQAGLLLRGEPG